MKRQTKDILTDLVDSVDALANAVGSLRMAMASQQGSKAQSEHLEQMATDLGIARGTPIIVRSDLIRS